MCELDVSTWEKKKKKTNMGFYLYKVCSLEHRHWRSSTWIMCCLAHLPRSKMYRASHSGSIPLDSSQACRGPDISRSCLAVASSYQL